MKRRMKKEKLKIFKDATKEGGSKKPEGEGNFLERVKEKYGDDVLVGNQEHSSDESEGSHEEPSEEEVGPKFEEAKNDHENGKPVDEKVLGKRL